MALFLSVSLSKCLIMKMLSNSCVFFLVWHIICVKLCLDAFASSLSETQLHQDQNSKMLIIHRTPL